MGFGTGIASSSSSALHCSMLKQGGPSRIAGATLRSDNLVQCKIRIEYSDNIGGDQRPATAVLQPNLCQASP